MSPFAQYAGSIIGIGFAIRIVWWLVVLSFPRSPIPDEYDDVHGDASLLDRRKP